MVRAAQIAVEFSFMVMLAFVFFAVVLILVAAYLRYTSRQTGLAALQDEASSLQQELLLASNVQDGYRRTILIPDELDGRPYSIANDASLLTLSFDDGTTYSRDIPPVSGSFAIGSDTIRTLGGSIIITQP